MYHADVPRRDVPRRDVPRRDVPRRWEWISSNLNSSNWLVGNSQMAKFNGLQGDYQIAFKRGGRVMELIAEAEWLVSRKKATHVLIDGIQNSIPDIMQGYFELETDVLERLKVLNRRALVVMAEVLYSPQHSQYNDKLHQVNRQVRRINREASGLASPQPWRVLGSIQRDRSRKQKDKVIVFPDSFSRDGYHINHSKVLEYEAELAAFMKAMVASTSASTSTSTSGKQA